MCVCVCVGTLVCVCVCVCMVVCVHGSENNLANKCLSVVYIHHSLRTKSYKDAVLWYEKAVNTTQQDDSGEFDATMDYPIYQLQAKMAEMYLEGGFGLQKDPSTAGS